MCTHIHRAFARKLFGGIRKNEESFSLEHSKSCSLLHSVTNEGADGTCSLKTQHLRNRLWRRKASHHREAPRHRGPLQAELQRVEGQLLGVPRSWEMKFREAMVGGEAVDRVFVMQALTLVLCKFDSGETEQEAEF